MRKPKRRKKSKLEKTLEEGDLLFNFVISIWFLIQSIIFNGIFKIIFLHKTATFISTAIISILSINVIFKIVDIYVVYTAETLQEKVIREIQEKREAMPKL